ncbi:MAG: DUF2178 domain-containing protein [Bacteroidales bacterium]|nr:DUF2178 domain-containing protein [Bacteroidales bacterium]
MKKVIIALVISLLALGSAILWITEAGFSGSLSEILEYAGIVILVGFALWMGLSRMKSLNRGEPAEDELSKKIMLKASSLSYYISIYVWLAVMYISDKTEYETHAVIGGGIIAMALVFFFSWLFVRLNGVKNE